MRILLYFILTVLLLSVIVSCHQREESNLVEQATDLYAKSLKMTQAYTDSILNSKDSAQVNRLTAAFEEAMTKLNYQYPPDTDMDMDEGQNDTLSNMNLKYIQARDSMLYYFAHHRVEPDSIPTDSIPISEN